MNKEVFYGPQAPLVFFEGKTGELSSNGLDEKFFVLRFIDVVAFCDKKGKLHLTFFVKPHAYHFSF